MRSADSSEGNNNIDSNRVTKTSISDQKRKTPLACHTIHRCLAIEEEEEKTRQKLEHSLVQRSCREKAGCFTRLFV